MLYSLLLSMTTLFTVYLFVKDSPCSDFVKLSYLLLKKILPIIFCHMDNKQVYTLYYQIRLENLITMHM